MKTRRKPKFKFYTVDWNPNGTNDLIVRDAKTGELIDAEQEVLYGIDVDKLPGRPQVFKETDPDFPEYRISRERLKKSVCTSPYPGTFESNCAFIKKYMK